MIGAHLGGYIIEAELGRGATGTVYRARQVSLDRLVAVKVLHRPLAADADFVARLRREAAAIAALNHDNIVRIFGLGEYEGVPYYAMEYLEGETVKARLERAGPLPLKTALRILAHVARGVHAAHEAGIIHRDLKPENILLLPSGPVKVMDFGAARQAAPDAPGLTRTGSLIGTPAFMSPEQAAGKTATRESDIYSLGVVFYEMLSGRLPFEHPDLLVLLQMHQWEEPKAPRAVVPKLPVAVEEIILKMLSKAPADRYATCAALIEDLRHVARGTPEHSSACGTRTTGAVGMDLAGPAGASSPPPGDTGVGGEAAASPGADPFTALADLRHGWRLEQARTRRVTVHLRSGGVLHGSMGHFARGHMVLTVPDVGEIGFPADLLAPTPITYGLDESELRQESQAWAELFYAHWTKRHDLDPMQLWVGQMLADAKRALPPTPAPPYLEALRALVPAWEAVCAAEGALAALHRGAAQTGSGTVLLSPEASHPDQVILATGQTISCRIEQENATGWRIERADGRRVRLTPKDVRCVLKNVPTPDAPRPAPDAFADRLTLRGGRVIACTILDRGGDAVQVRRDDGREVRVYLRELRCVEWGDAADGADGTDTAFRTQELERTLEDAHTAYRAAVTALVAAVPATPDGESGGA